MTEYGDISPRTAAYVSQQLLERAMPYTCMARFGQQKPIPKGKTKSQTFRRYDALTPSTVPLVEGVTPDADQIHATDVTATLSQYGRRIEITDVIEDTHEDPVLNEMTSLVADLAGQTVELVIYHVIRAGTNVLYTSGASRSAVASAITTTALNRAIRALKRQNTKLVTRMLAASDKVATGPIRAGFIAFCHPDLQTDLEGLTGWKDKSEYASGGAMLENEMGAYKEIRFFSSTLYAPWLAAGGSSASLLSNGEIPSGSVACDVYPIVSTGRDAYATCPLAGKTAITPIVLNPGKPSKSDPLGQRGSVGFKTWLTAVILNDAWMIRVETACNG